MLVTKLFRSIVAAAALAVAVPAAAQDRTASTAIKDAWITTQIQAKYFGDSVVKGRNIDVDTRSGAVTLTGEVSSAAERTRAVEKAREVDGVTTVHDKLTIVSGKADHAVNRTKVKNKADKAAPDPIQWIAPRSIDPRRSKDNGAIAGPKAFFTLHPRDCRVD